ncbi:hypothetical protein HK405_007069 [Cladochytrium tenue]|nr:hypothetical protein HK405_007069 [Cladochytrium tenue]
MANNGSLPDGAVLLRPETAALATEPGDVQEDRVIGFPMCFSSAGFGIFPDLFGSDGDHWYGWTGAGGSIMLWSYRLNIAVAYAMNFPEFESLADRRSRRLVKAVVEIAKSFQGAASPAAATTSLADDDAVPGHNDAAAEDVPNVDAVDAAGNRGSEL